MRLLVSSHDPEIRELVRIADGLELLVVVSAETPLARLSQTALALSNVAHDDHQVVIAAGAVAEVIRQVRNASNVPVLACLALKTSKLSVEPDDRRCAFDRVHAQRHDGGC